MKQKTYDDDDGRTIADMSGVQRDSMFLPRSLKKHGTFAEKEEEEATEPQYTNEQRRTAVGGASELYTLNDYPSSFLPVRSADPESGSAPHPCPYYIPGIALNKRRI